MDIGNASELDALMRKIARELLEAVAKEVLEDFKEYVQRYVYDVNKDPIEYQRTMEFKEAWGFSEILSFADYLETTMKIDPFSMSSHATTYNGVDVRESLAAILNNDTDGFDYNGDGRYHGAGRYDSSHWASRKSGAPYWDIFWSEYVEGGKLDFVVGKHARGLGLTVAFG